MDWSEGEKPKDCEADFVLNPRRREAARREQAKRDKIRALKSRSRRTVLFLRPSKKFFDIEKCIIIQEYFHNLPFWSGERTERAVSEKHFSRIDRL